MLLHSPSLLVQPIPAALLLGFTCNHFEACEEMELHRQHSQGPVMIQKSEGGHEVARVTALNQNLRF